MKLGKGVFIVGTDTGVGKTFVTAGLLRLLRDEGLDAVPMKPIQTGAVEEDGRLVSPDLRFCLRTAHLNPPPDVVEMMSPYRFKTACSPHLAAQMEGVSIDIDRVIESFNQLRQRYEAVLVEGIGGLMVPISETEMTLELITKMSAPVVLVARSGLGTLNHTLLSLSVLRARNVKVFGIILNTAEQAVPDFIAHDNAKTIEDFGGVNVLGRVGELTLPGDIAGHFRESLPGWRTILDRLKPA